MNMQQWQDNTDALAMLKSLKVFKKNESYGLRRKLILLAVACIKHFETYLLDRRSIDFLKVMEELAPSSVKYPNPTYLINAVAASADFRSIDFIYQNCKSMAIALRIARNVADAVAHLADMAPGFDSFNCWSCMFNSLQRCAVLIKDGFIPDTGNKKNAPDYCADLVRDIFTEKVYDEVLTTRSVLNMASTIFNECCFQDMPILGDALEDAGCANEEILNHCREPGLHVRGCWLLDLLLEKQLDGNF